MEKFVIVTEIKIGFEKLITEFKPVVVIDYAASKNYQNQFSHFKAVHLKQNNILNRLILDKLKSNSKIRITIDELDFYYKRSLKWQQWVNSTFNNVQQIDCINNYQAQSKHLKNYRHLYSKCIVHPIYKKWLTDILLA